MQHIPNSFGAFLKSCRGTAGAEEDSARYVHPNKSLLPCPGYVRGREHEWREGHWRAAASTGQLETPAEVDANTVGLRTLSERTLLARTPTTPGTAVL